MGKYRPKVPLGQEVKMQQGAVKAHQEAFSNPTGEILSDQSPTGKERPWRRNKAMSLAVAEGYRKIDMLKVSEQIADCGGYLRFAQCPKGHQKKLVGAFFCKKRLCTLCQWRKSLLTFGQVVTLAGEHYARRKTDRAMMLTLTVPNCEPQDLGETLSRMSKAWNSLRNNRRYKFITSWFRGTEVTYNAKTKTFHPHYHILLIVPKKYFEKKSGLYVERDQWLTDWARAYKDDSISQVDIRVIKKKSKNGKGFTIPSIDDMPNAVAEVAKYATKPSSYIEKTGEASYMIDKDVLKHLHNGLRRKRLVAFGGLFKKIKQELGMNDVESSKADLVHLEAHDKSCVCGVCGTDLVQQVYSWKLGVNEYVG